MWSSVGSTGLGFRLQSLKAPSYLEERVDTFITSYKQTLASMPDDDFQAKKDALVLQLLEAPKNLGEETSWFWYYIDQGYDDFLRGMFTLVPECRTRTHWDSACEHR